MVSDPLLDTLFRRTTREPSAAPSASSGPARPVVASAGTTPGPVPAAPAPRPDADPQRVATERASAAPVRTPGTRVRAGNAMSRTRAALLTGARAAVAVHGTRITMSEVAAAAGVAKATLYNHFRTRDAVLGALLQHEIDALVTELQGRPLPEALAGAAQRLGAHPDVRALAQLEPATLAQLARCDLDLPGWRRAHEAVDAALSAAGLGGASLVLRWLASHLTTPGTPASVADDLAVLLAALPPAGTRPRADDPLRSTA